MDYVIPSVTAIDYSVENNISLDYKFFYGEHYPESDSIPFKIDANVLKGIIAPLFQMRSFPEGFTELPDIAGYSPIGLCMNFAQVQFDTVSAGELTAPLPFPAGVFVEGNMDVLVVKKDDTYEVVTPSSIKTGYVEMVVDSDVKSIMLLRKTKNLNRAVAYLDGGMIYSRGNHARVRTDIALTGADSLSSGTFTVYYTGYTGTVTVDTFKTVSLRNIETNGSYVLGTVDEISMQNPIMVKKVRLQIPSDSIDLIQDSLTWAVNQEECLKITIKEGLSGFNSVPEPITTSYISSFSLESVSIGGDGRIFQTYGDSGIEYSYDFYLKDHLGSTRMVINSQDQITEAVAYQAYGAMVPLDSIANAPEIPAREKFTGKEFDQEGEDSANGVVGIQAYHFGARVYDPEVGVWLAVDPYEQDWNPYGYCGGNPVVFIDPDGNLWNTAGFIIGAAVGGTIGGIAAYNATDGNVGATIAGILVGGVWGGALGSMAGSGLSKLSDMGFFQSVGRSLKYSGNIFERIEARMIVKGLQMSSEVAKNLLGELSKNTVKDITVNIDRTSKGNHYNPNTGIATFNPELKTYYRKNQTTPKLPWQDNRDKVGLYHELRHAYQDINNQIPQSTYTNFNDRLKVELKNIGVGILKYTEKYSVNLFRESTGEALRDRYIVH